MYRSFLKTALRHLTGQKLFTFINVVGLSIAIMVVLVIFLYVSTETTVDNFHQNSSKIYRVLRKADINGENYLIGVTSGPFAPALQNDFQGQIKSVCRVYPNRGLVEYGDKKILEDKIFLADSNFLKMFSYPLQLGDRQTALDLPNSVLVTAETARKYFGNEDPLNKTLMVDGSESLLVTGVFDDFPKSHLDFDFVANIQVVKESSTMTDWWSNGLVTYAMLEENTSPETLEKEFPAFMDKYFGKDFTTNKNRIDLALQPLDEVYFDADVRYDRIAHGNITSVTIFAFIGIFVLIIAVINFTNLSTARSTLRMQEVGIRKILGSSRIILAIQFLIESFIISLLSVMFAYMALELFLPFFNSHFDLNLVLELSLSGWLLLLCLVVILGLLSGAYPAFVQSGFNPVNALSGNTGGGYGDRSLFRRVLVIIQFAISIILVTGTLLIGKQLNYIHSRDLGFDKDHVILVKLNNSKIYNERESFKHQIAQSPFIEHVSQTTGGPGGFHDTYSLEVEGMEDNPRMRTVFTDLDFVKTFGLGIVAGRDFSQSYGTDRHGSVILNETAVGELNLTPEEVLGTRIMVKMLDSSYYRQVVGVVRDYNFTSLRTRIEPLIIIPYDWGGVYGVKLKKGMVSEAVSDIETAWKRFSPEYPLDYTYLDESLRSLYAEEERQVRLMSVFSGLSIFIACLGIIGLASFSASQRVKEIGIRKVLGASVGNLSWMLIKNYLKWVIVANIIAWPIAFYLVDQWLQNFAYRIPVQPDVFLWAAIIALVVALAAVSAQTLKAALSDPVRSIREE